MPARGRTTANFRPRSRYTGESYQYLRQALPKVGLAPLDAGEPGQTLLEHAVFAVMIRLGGNYTAHPLGITSVFPQTDGSLVVCLDPLLWNFGDPAPFVDEVLTKLLPAADDGERQIGVPDLEVRGVQHRDLELGLAKRLRDCGYAVRSVFAGRST